MKKLIFIIIVILFCSNLAVVNAEESVSDDLDGAIDSVISGINEDDLEDVLDILSNLYGDKKTIKDRILDFITGDGSFSFSGIISFIKNIFSSTLSQVISIISCVLFIGLLYTLINIINFKKYDNNENNAIYYICYSIVLTLFVQLIFKVLSIGENLIDSVSKIVEITFPILIALSEFSGGFGSALFKPLSSIASLISSEIFSGVFLPIISVCFICVIVGNLSNTIKLSSLNKTLLSLIKWILGILTLVFSITITAKGVVNGQYNGLSFKILKYTTGSMIPIVGNFLSGGLDVLTSSAILVKNSFGFIVVICIVNTVLKSGLTVLIVSFLLRFLVSICEPILDVKFLKLSNGLCEIFNVFSAVIFFSGFIYALVCFSLINSTALVI